MYSSAWLKAGALNWFVDDAICVTSNVVAYGVLGSSNTEEVWSSSGISSVLVGSVSVFVACDS